MSAADEVSLSRFAWIIVRVLKFLGKVWASWITGLVPQTASVQPLIDRVLHLNEVLSYFIPSLTHILSQKVLEGDYFVFRAFTDDADKVSEIYEPIVRQMLSPCLSEVVVDIGANIGVHTVWLSRKVGPSGVVLAVEPERTNFTILNLNKRINNLSNVIPIMLALGADSGEAQVLVPRPSVMGQVTTISSSTLSKPSVVTVDCETLDDVILAFGVSQVSAIKIDVEGAELGVIQGAEQTIMKFRPRLVIEAHGLVNLSSLELRLKAMGMTISSNVKASSRPNETRWFVFASYPSQSRDSIE
jgi:FkbM family methyltransferase